MSNNFIICTLKNFLFCLYSNFKFQLYIHYINDYYWNLKFFLKCVTSLGGGGGGVRDLWQFVTGGRGGSKIAKNSVTSFMDGPFEGDSFDSACICRIFEVVVPLESDNPGMVREVHMPGRVLVCTGVLVERLQRCYVKRYCRIAITLPYM